MDAIVRLLQITGFSQISWQQAVMIVVGLLFVFLAIFKKTEPLLLLPIGFGCVLANLPATGITEPPNGIIYLLLHYGVETEFFPLLIFLGLGAMIDFGPLIANPWTILMGAAAQLGVFVAMLFAQLIGFSIQEAASIGIIGGADGPTTIYTAVALAPHLLGTVALAAYTYMSLVPIIQPPTHRNHRTPQWHHLSAAALWSGDRIFPAADLPRSGSDDRLWPVNR